ncbi:MAG TPA: AprI/Inh family metalloprotease inhibitor, partial [Pseudolabrys sp.]|nr:AprI/Inh family metalloprotease inhibitor [Pseudolabrys sp.]
MTVTRCTIAFVAVCLAGNVSAQAPPQLGESAKRVVGSWEFSNADRDRTCTATLKGEPGQAGLKVEFDANCVNLFPLVKDIAGWKFPENDLLYFVDVRGRAIVEFSEVEDGLFEAPTPGVGVLFLQNAAAAAGPSKPAEQVAGDWAIVRRGGAPVCLLTLAMTKTGENLAVSVKPGCDAAIARVNFTQWRIDRDE